MKALHDVALELTGLLGPALIRSLYRGLRFEVTGRDHLASIERDGGPVVFVAWHGRLLPLLYWYRDRGVVILVSAHRDGEYLARMARGLGYGTVRGSSTHGAHQALRSAIRAVRTGHSLAITPDGPQGPRERMKPGALEVARVTGAPLVPILAGARQAWWIEGWDRFMIPKPFSRIRIAVGSPRKLPRTITPAGLEGVARSMETELADLKARVDEASVEAPAAS
jgi:lysophospholipid acyltransferase (LPLAT)-like uncharacterized protein